MRRKGAFVLIAAELVFLAILILVGETRLRAYRQVVEQGVVVFVSEGSDSEKLGNVYGEAQAEEGYAFYEFHLKVENVGETSVDLGNYTLTMEGETETCKIVSAAPECKYLPGQRTGYYTVVAQVRTGTVAVSVEWNQEYIEDNHMVLEIDEE